VREGERERERQERKHWPYRAPPQLTPPQLTHLTHLAETNPHHIPERKRGRRGREREAEEEARKLT